VEINTRMHKVLDHGANPNPEANPDPLREGVASTRFSLFGSVSAAYAILSFHHARGFVHDLGGTHSALRGVNMPEDTVRWEANHACNDKMWAC
jgi:hypothetical protein